MDSENLIDNAANVGEYLLEQLHQMPQLKDVRGRGLMIGAEVEGSASDVRKKLLFDHHIFTGGAGEHTVRLLPPLTLTMDEARQFITEFKKCLSEL